MKTPEEVISNTHARVGWNVGANNGSDVIKALDAAGYHITANMPPNTAVNVTTDERGHIVQFKAHGETQETRQSED